MFARRGSLFFAAFCLTAAKAEICEGCVDAEGLSLLQHKARLDSSISSRQPTGHHQGSATGHHHGSATVTLGCDSLDLIKDKVAELNGTAEMTENMSDTFNSSAQALLATVGGAVNGTAVLLEKVKTAVAAVAVFNGGAATKDAVADILDQILPALLAVEPELATLVDGAVLTVGDAVHALSDAVSSVYEQYAGAIEQVSVLCEEQEDSSALSLRNKGIPKVLHRFQHLLGKKPDAFDKAEAEIVAANASIAEITSTLDDINATAVGQLLEMLDVANTSLTALKDELLPKVLEKADGTIPAPVMAIVTKQVNAAFEKSLVVIDDLAVLVANVTTMIGDNIDAAKAQLAPVYEAADDLTAVVEEARAAAEVASASDSA